MTNLYICTNYVTDENVEPYYRVRWAGEDAFFIFAVLGPGPKLVNGKR